MTTPKSKFKHKKLHSSDNIDLNFYSEKQKSKFKDKLDKLERPSSSSIFSTNNSISSGFLRKGSSNSLYISNGKKKNSNKNLSDTLTHSARLKSTNIFKKQMEILNKMNQETHQKSQTDCFDQEIVNRRPYYKRKKFVSFKPNFIHIINVESWKSYNMDVTSCYKGYKKNINCECGIY